MRHLIQISFFTIFFIPVLKAQSWSLEYFGNNAWNTGIAVKYDYTLHAYFKINQRDNSKFIQKQMSIKTGFFHDPGIYSLGFVSFGLTNEKTYPNGRWTSLKWSPIGIGRTFLPKTYQVDENRIVSELPVPGRWYYLPSLEYNFGFLKGDGIINRFYAGVNVMIMVPYNTFVMPLINLQLGYKFTNTHKP